MSLTPPRSCATAPSSGARRVYDTWRSLTCCSISEKNTSRTCLSCGPLTGPQGVNGLRVRCWMCFHCGEWHDRDVNAARNILRRAEVPASVSRNESSTVRVPPRRASRSRKAGREPAGTVA
ncbi:MAG TPA: zinc ribbon domain-containing protein [Steroidobacteraceae bacterium]|nr:zinc ribbon domain-containing protein [Steroidobacteraceae bacterium]